MTFFKMIKAFFTIPMGMYCYHIKRIEWRNKKLPPRIITKQCGFYSNCEDNRDTLCGYCSFMEGEMDDQIKFCGIRESK